MIRKHSESFIAESSGRVDKVASESGMVPRPAFSHPSAVIIVNGRKAKKSQKVEVGDEVKVEWDEEVFEGLEAEDIPLSVLYEDDDILVIDKAQGMVVHPGAGVYSGTLANALLSRYGSDFSTSDDESRPGIVHRLDKDTSGVMVIARSIESHHALQEEFASHEAIKHYAAIAKGFFPERRMVIDAPLERDPRDRKRYMVTREGRGKSAVTELSVIASDHRYSLLDVRIYTGRTHQIRVHLSSIGHPVLGDPIYSSRDKAFPDATLMLHSASLSIRHPRTGVEMTFRAPLPERFIRTLGALSLAEAADAFK